MNTVVMNNKRLERERERARARERERERASERASERKGCMTPRLWLTGLFETPEGLVVAHGLQVVMQVARGAAPLPQQAQQRAARAAVPLQYLQRTQLHLLGAGGHKHRNTDRDTVMAFLIGVVDHSFWVAYPPPSVCRSVGPR